MSYKQLNKQSLARNILKGAASISLQPNIKTETPIIIRNPLENREEGFKGDLEVLRGDSLKIGQDLIKAVENTAK